MLKFLPLFDEHHALGVGQTEVLYSSDTEIRWCRSSRSICTASSSRTVMAQFVFTILLQFSISARYVSTVEPLHTHKSLTALTVTNTRYLSTHLVVLVAL